MRSPLLSALPSVLALAIPLAFALAAAGSGPRHALRRAARAAGAALGLAALLALGMALVPAGDRAAPPWLRLDGVTAVMLGLVSFVAVVVVRFSRAYLQGDPGRPRYARWLMATLAAVTLLVLANDLLLLGLAWVGTSLALHQLLTFYADRPQALVAAHKKFLASRLADLCLFAGIALLRVEVGSLDLDPLAAWAAAVPALPPAAELAAVLLALGACLKCAQLPFHGWLIQVMEAPTPVSALLHAGVVNIGGFLMIRLAPLMVKAPTAQLLLVIVGGATAAVAALVMTTRVSVKVSLAWSTCAQMGFMLVQCGLGAYHLALLHIVAHSLYKAHAFLGSGSAVDLWRAQALLPVKTPAGLRRWFGAALLAPAAVTAVAWLFRVDPAQEPALWVLATVLSLALVPLVVGGGGPARLAAVGLGAMGVAALYFTWHALFARLLPPAPADAMEVRLGVALAVFVGLFVVQAVLQARPGGQLARALYPRLYAGLYLDEAFTRLTFHVRPPRLPAAVSAVRVPAVEAAQNAEAGA